MLDSMVRVSRRVGWMTDLLTADARARLAPTPLRRTTRQRLQPLSDQTHTDESTRLGAGQD